MGLRLHRRLFCTCLALALVGCTALAPLDDGGALFSGRLAWQSAGSAQTPAQRASAQFELRGSARAGEMALTGPLGVLLVRARWQP
ncbi:MAG: hypothetical protein ACKOB5_08550, partial [Betaproteobacteria bacterium]